mmetsp:Transcript_26237/g.40035  ORF Transcript_26237/g.40035 Transcript_26237/m.40035 type:complete len:171 (+) Transcript_26237:992-1504(+)
MIIDELLKSSGANSGTPLDRTEDGTQSKKTGEASKASTTCSKFVQIYKHTFSLFQNEFTVLQIVDVSDQIIVSRSKGEKKLLSLINATVSHEMRTPINSINSQNVQLKYLIGRLEEVLVPGAIEKADPALFKEKLKRIMSELKHCWEVMSRSTKFLIFVVNDMLDLSQLN